MDINEFSRAVSSILKFDVEENTNRYMYLCFEKPSQPDDDRLGIYCTRKIERIHESQEQGKLLGVILCKRNQNGYCCIAQFDRNLEKVNAIQTDEYMEIEIEVKEEYGIDMLIRNVRSDGEEQFYIDMKIRNTKSGHEGTFRSLVSWSEEEQNLDYLTENFNGEYTFMKHTKKVMPVEMIRDSEVARVLYDSVEEKVDRELYEKFKNMPNSFGLWHRIWDEKKKILREEYGIDWKSPNERNLYVVFD